MEIDINQKKISIGDKYTIFTDGKESHRASRRLFRFMPEVELFDKLGNTAVMTLRKKLAFFVAKYVITRRDGTVYHFTTKSFWKSHYQCQVGSDLYEIYGHRRRKYSIYKNDRQIAWWQKAAVSWFAGDNYKIIADRNVDNDLLIAFCLVIDNYASDDHDGKMVSIDIGKLGPQAKVFDENWRPKL